MQIVIIGASISGMMAAARWPDAVLLELGRPEDLAPVMVATFYAHQRVPVFAEEEIEVQTQVVGHGGAREYAFKVYGDPEALVSQSSIRSLSRAWLWDGKALAATIQGRTHFTTPATYIDLNRKLVQTSHRTFLYDSLIVTAPLPLLLALTGIPMPVQPFRSEPIWLEMWPAEEMGYPILPAGRMVVRYFPDMDIPWYRSNQRGNEVELEYTDRMVPERVRKTGRVLRPGKIWAHPAAASFVALLEQFDVHCLGRYARWEQKWLSHQTWEQIQQMAL